MLNIVTREAVVDERFSTFPVVLDTQLKEAFAAKSALLLTFVRDALVDDTLTMDAVFIDTFTKEAFIDRRNVPFTVVSDALLQDRDDRCCAYRNITERCIFR